MPLQLRQGKAVINTDSQEIKVKFEYLSTKYSPDTSLCVVVQHCHLIDTEVGKNAIGITSLCFFNRIFGLISREHTAYEQLATQTTGKDLSSWLAGSVPSHLFKLFQLQETGSSVPLQFGQVGIQLTCLKEAQGVVVPLKSLRIVSGLGGTMSHYVMCSLAQSCAAQQR